MLKVDKINIKKYYINNKKYLKILFIIFIIGIISGSVFTCYLSSNDQLLAKNYVSSFINNIKDNNLNYIDCLKNNLISNIPIIVIIWILGISIIGIPINLFLYFIKSFIIGFSISAFILKYKAIGIIYSLCYIFPHHIINFILYSTLLLYSLKFSSILIYSIINKKEISFKNIINKYLKIFIITFIGIIITSLLETYLVPIIFNKILLFIK
ncbi:MAG: stage II sporulation protein M [Bacilli bacterium]|nr:stage II sporulation protein M [Bacilli bacterium]